MQIRVLDVDGSLTRQARLMRRARPSVLSLRDWGPRLRLACRHGSFARFEDHLAELAGSGNDFSPFLTFLGSGDFHHLSLALLRRLPEPCNLLVIDKHPDWMRGIPVLHCGTWLFHAAQLPNVQRIFHVGGAVDFDNHYRWLAPWPLIRSGKIIVAPACQRFRGRAWNQIEHWPLRCRPVEAAGRKSIDNWLTLYRDDLAACPLYVSVDKDVLTAEEAIVNWDSGRLTMPEVLAAIAAFGEAAGGALAGMDVVGDWSPVVVEGWMRRFLDWSEHPKLLIDADAAARRNEAVNLRILDAVSVKRPTLAQPARGASKGSVADSLRESERSRGATAPH